MTLPLKKCDSSLIVLEFRGVQHFEFIEIFLVWFALFTQPDSIMSRSNNCRKKIINLKYTINNETLLTVETKRKNVKNPKSHILYALQK